MEGREALWSAVPSTAGLRRTMMSEELLRHGSNATESLLNNRCGAGITFPIGGDRSMVNGADVAGGLLGGVHVVREDGAERFER
jgi:hypothetical protein